MLKRRGYDDWAGAVTGYGPSLEIRVYAVRRDPDIDVPRDRARSDAPTSTPTLTGSRRGKQQQDRIEALLAFRAAADRRG